MSTGRPSLICSIIRYLDQSSYTVFPLTRSAVSPITVSDYLVPDRSRYSHPAPHFELTVTAVACRLSGQSLKTSRYRCSVLPCQGGKVGIVWRPGRSGPRKKKRYTTARRVPPQAGLRGCGPLRASSPPPFPADISGPVSRSRRLRRCSSWLHHAQDSALRAHLAIVQPVHIIHGNALLSATS